MVPCDQAVAVRSRRPAKLAPGESPAEALGRTRTSDFVLAVAEANGTIVHAPGKGTVSVAGGRRGRLRGLTPARSTIHRRSTKSRASVVAAFG
jgi:hypothetical protein